MLEETIEQNAALLQMRNKIILTISHDIRSPLNVISATVELARREVDNQRRDTYLSNIESVCLHVVHLLNNLLDVYRLNQSKEECNYVRSVCMKCLIGLLPVFRSGQRQGIAVQHLV